MMLTLEEIRSLMPLLDAGIRATGLQVFQTGQAAALQSALTKLQQMANEASKAQQEQESR